MPAGRTSLTADTERRNTRRSRAFFGGRIDGSTSGELSIYGYTIVTTSSAYHRLHARIDHHRRGRYRFIRSPTPRHVRRRSGCGTGWCARSIAGVVTTVRESVPEWHSRRSSRLEQYRGPDAARESGGYGSAFESERRTSGTSNPRSRYGSNTVIRGVGRSVPRSRSYSITPWSSSFGRWD